ncbi:unnamed protein product [Caenorhabditis auriculariae]|uniref:Serine/threonine-protein phosphatase n=1 Tax=Caenorhabditis auriculariae TaxID=2777116 RepID=A0A8S1HXT2_9PELO|nr:unnamed protein product [Caenorhabditis auriculariae]
MTTLSVGEAPVQEEASDLARRMIHRIMRFGTVDGFSDDQICQILRAAKTVLAPLPALIPISSPVVVFGDLHGQLGDLLRFLKVVGKPPKYQLLFLGDYVDRCKKSLELMLLLFCMMLRYPNRVHLLRGNHEVQKVNRIYGFYEELRRKRNSAIWTLFQEVFAEFPLCAMIQGKILCMHGGLSELLKNHNSLEVLTKPKKPIECDTGLAVDLMWSDANRDTSAPSFKFNASRGVSVLFTKADVEKVCEELNVDMIIRAHELVPDGHEFLFENRLLTLFSAPNYCGKENNCGSVLKISKSLKMYIVSLKPKRNQAALKEERAKILTDLNAVNFKNPDPCCRRVKRRTLEKVPELAIDFQMSFTPPAHVVQQPKAYRKTSESYSLSQVKNLITEATKANIISGSTSSDSKESSSTNSAETSPNSGSSSTQEGKTPASVVMKKVSFEKVDELNLKNSS